MNTATLVGRLATDPQLRSTSGGSPVVSFRLAVRNRHRAASSLLQHLDLRYSPTGIRILRSALRFQRADRTQMSSEPEASVHRPESRDIQLAGSSVAKSSP